MFWRCNDAVAPGAARLPVQATEQEPDWRSCQRAGSGARGADASGGGRERERSAGCKGAAHDAGQAVRGDVRALWLPHRAPGEKAGASEAAAPRRSASPSTLLRQPLRAPARDHALRGAGRAPSHSTLRICCARARSSRPAATPCRRSCCRTRRRSCCPCCFCRLSACARWTSQTSACSAAPMVSVFLRDRLVRPRLPALESC